MNLQNIRVKVKEQLAFVEGVAADIDGNVKDVQKWQKRLCFVSLVTHILGLLGILFKPGSKWIGQKCNVNEKKLGRILKSARGFAWIVILANSACVWYLKLKLCCQLKKGKGRIECIMRLLYDSKKPETVSKVSRDNNVNETGNEDADNIFWKPEWDVDVKLPWHLRFYEFVVLGFQTLNFLLLFRSSKPIQTYQRLEDLHVDSESIRKSANILAESSKKVFNFGVLQDKLNIYKTSVEEMHEAARKALSYCKALLDSYSLRPDVGKIVPGSQLSQSYVKGKELITDVVENCSNIKLLFEELSSLDENTRSTDLLLRFVSTGVKLTKALESMHENLNKIDIYERKSFKILNITAKHLDITADLLKECKDTRDTEDTSAQLIKIVKNITKKIPSVISKVSEWKDPLNVIVQHWKTYHWVKAKLWPNAGPGWLSYVKNLNLESLENTLDLEDGSRGVSEAFALANGQGIKDLEDGIKEMAREAIQIYEETASHVLKKAEMQKMESGFFHPERHSLENISKKMKSVAGKLGIKFPEIKIGRMGMVNVYLQLLDKWHLATIVTGFGVDVVVLTLLSRNSNFKPVSEPLRHQVIKIKKDFEELRDS